MHAPLYLTLGDLFSLIPLPNMRFSNGACRKFCFGDRNPISYVTSRGIFFTCAWVDKTSIFKKLENSGRRGKTAERTPDAMKITGNVFTEFWSHTRCWDRTVETHVMCKTPAISVTQTHSADQISSSSHQSKLRDKRVQRVAFGLEERAKRVTFLASWTVTNGLAWPQMCGSSYAPRHKSAKHALDAGPASSLTQSEMVCAFGCVLYVIRTSRSVHIWSAPAWPSWSTEQLVAGDTSA